MKHIPVHPTLAAMLAEWRLSGCEQMMGRQPTPDDLVIPLPPDTIAKRTKRAGIEPFRGHDYTGKRWRKKDLPTLGWRKRSVYDTKSTFITLAIEDGADPAIIRDRVTHTKPRRSAFDGYDRGPHWNATCAEVAKLRVSRRTRVTGRVIPIKSSSKNVAPQSVRISNRIHRVEVPETAADANAAVSPATCGDQYRAMLDADPELTRADLAQRLGVSRAAITQALRRQRIAEHSNVRVCALMPKSRIE